MTFEGKIIAENFVAAIKPGDLVTLVGPGSLCGCYKIQGKVISVEVSGYAQYSHGVKLVLKPFRKKLARQYRFYGTPYYNNYPAVYKGYVDVDTNPFTDKEISPNGTTVQTSKYLSGDERYLTDALASTTEKPVFSPPVAEDWRKTLTKIRVVTETGTEEFETVEAAKAKYDLSTLCGPTNDGDAQRYESAEINRLLSA